jgi:hypothetical protein
MLTAPGPCLSPGAAGGASTGIEVLGPPAPAAGTTATPASAAAAASAEGAGASPSPGGAKGRKRARHEAALAEEHSAAAADGREDAQGHSLVGEGRGGRRARGVQDVRQRAWACQLPCVGRSGTRGVWCAALAPQLGGRSVHSEAAGPSGGGGGSGGGAAAAGPSPREPAGASMAGKAPRAAGTDGGAGGPGGGAPADNAKVTRRRGLPRAALPPPLRCVRTPLHATYPGCPNPAAWS